MFREAESQCNRTESMVDRCKSHICEKRLMQEDIERFVEVTKCRSHDLQLNIEVVA